ncbi:MAG: hypothetical protein ABI557_16315, partial [Aureliella sp.]
MSSGGASVPDNSSNESSYSDNQSSAKKSSPDLLRHVLEETLAAGSNAMTSQEWETLQDLARIHSTDDLDMNQIAEKLVSAL